MRRRYRLFKPAPLWGISLSSNHQLDVTSLTGPWYKPTPQIQYTTTYSRDAMAFPDPEAIPLVAQSLQHLLRQSLHQGAQAHSRLRKPKAVVAVPSPQVIGQSHRLQDLGLCAETPEAHQAQAAYIHQLAQQHWPSDPAEMALDYRCSPMQADHSITIEWVACHRKWIQAWDQAIREAGLSPYRIEPEHQAWWRVLRAHEAAFASQTDPSDNTDADMSAAMALLCCEQDQLILTVWQGPHCRYRHHNTLIADTGLGHLETLAQHLQRARVSTGITHWSRCYLSSDPTLKATDIAWLEATAGVTLLPLPFDLKGVGQLTVWGLALQRSTRPEGTHA